MFYIIFELEKNVHISTTRCSIEMGFGFQCSILNGQAIYIEKSKLNVADMWLIPLDRVTYCGIIFSSITKHLFNGSQLAKMKKYIPNMPLP